MKLFSVAMLASAFLAAAPALATNLVSNGNFETGTFSGWTANGDVVIEATPYFGFTSGQYGSYAATFNGGNSRPNGDLSQTINTNIGQKYDLNFNYGVVDFLGNSQSIIVSVLDSTTNAVLSSTTVTNNSPVAPLSSLLFKATSGGSIVVFRDAADNLTFDQDGAIDNVSVTPAVPEPATWAMMIVGMGAVGFSLRRRTTVVALHA